MAQNILFVTNRNILTTCGELRLIKNRAETLFSTYGISTDFLAIANSRRINAVNKENIKAGGNVFIIKQDIRNPLTILTALNTLKNELRKRIQSKQYNAVILSGSGMPLYAKFIKKMDSSLKVYADVHGSSEDILELVKSSNLIKKIFNRAIFELDRQGLKRSVDYLDGYFVVTEDLQQYVKMNFQTRPHVKFYIAPCATVSIDENYFDNYEEYRKIYRQKYLLNEDTKVFIYSGGVSSWQCLAKTLDLYKEIKKHIPNSKLLIFSHNKEGVLKLSTGVPNMVVDSYMPEELTKALCAGDFAFMLRTDCVTNNVAFPNKYLEYVQSKMKIITTPFVHEIAKQITQNQIGYLYNMTGQLDGLLDFICRSKGNEDSTVKKVLDYNSFEKRLATFSHDIFQ